ncbi:cytochrome c biogenesis protein ResB [Paenibacillus baekrokdamisoli]|uniref:Cytochrome c biogenesis protein ResB n=1 Tax=Paenibacillus baekrokdamisoli TaxID=1712516 RepID=A0A3G9JB17_9BACL|nr:cytochrome c biogenesis protein ResB [Paenibacillus baekrokdamisoli]MBB3069608.1 cytochrome c biogenesis protein [Paenibacillus baekrokdamisoli]BBH21038.1 cytochrome c biogenesis protein ResB [Paenibacillus baekrokdamisoli]
MLKFENTKCECGHQNPVGTVLCENCGNPLDIGDEESEDRSAPLEMRYDGIARRSQKSNPSIIDRVWSFFSSVKIAVRLIVITLIAAMVGTIFTQENAFVSFDPSTYYEDRYGWIGKWYYKLGLSNTYESWWFIGLLVMIGTSLVICSLDRVLPLYRALNKQQIRKHHQFLTRQKTVYTADIEGEEEIWTGKIADQLKRRHFRVTKDGTALLAEKNRFSRWGPYINHIGLIVFLLAVLLRSLPGWSMDNYVTVPEGETVQIPDTSYFIKNEKFTINYYTDKELPKELQGTARAKLYETQSVLYKCTANCDDPSLKPELVEVKRHNIIVNDPLSYKGLKAYQFGFDDTPKLKSVKPSLFDKKTGKEYGSFVLDMRNPQLNYKLGPYSLELKQTYMDFALNTAGQPTTKSREPNAPAFVFVIKGPDLPAGGMPYMYFPKQIDKQRFSQDLINGEIGQKFELKVKSMADVSFAGVVTSLNIRTDRAMPYIWVGAGISMFGLLIGTYWQHRRVWLRIDKGRVTLGAHTNKNNYGMRADVAFALRGVGVVVEPKSLDNGRNKS